MQLPYYDDYHNRENANDANETKPDNRRQLRASDTHVTYEKVCEVGKMFAIIFHECYR